MLSIFSHVQWTHVFLLSENGLWFFAWLSLGWFIFYFWLGHVYCKLRDSQLFVIYIEKHLPLFYYALWFFPDIFNFEKKKVHFYAVKVKRLSFTVSHLHFCPKRSEVRIIVVSFWTLSTVPRIYLDTVIPTERCPRSRIRL